MRTVLGWLLLVSVLLAQSAWAFEGHAGHFEAETGCEHSMGSQSSGDPGTPAGGHHCAHSPVHFVAVHQDSLPLAGDRVSGELPPYHAPVSFLYAEPPVQPPRG